MFFADTAAVTLECLHCCCFLRKKKKKTTFISNCCWSPMLALSLSLFFSFLPVSILPVIFPYFSFLALILELFLHAFSFLFVYPLFLTLFPNHPWFILFFLHLSFGWSRFFFFFSLVFSSYLTPSEETVFLALSPTTFKSCVKCLIFISFQWDRNLFK